MNIWRPITITVVAAASLLLLATAASAEEPTRVHGDLNCDYQVDGGDAIQLLSDLSNEASPQSPESCVDPQSGVVPGDVDCDETVGMGDVIALVRNMAGIQTAAGVDCAAPGDSVGAPALALACEAGAEPLTVHCRYDGSESETEFDPTIDAADGAISNVFPIKSVNCDPDDNCQYAASAEFLVTFASPDPREISVTACDIAACATRTVTVWP